MFIEVDLMKLIRGKKYSLQSRHENFSPFFSLHRQNHTWVWRSVNTFKPSSLHAHQLQILSPATIFFFCVQSYQSLSFVSREMTKINNGARIIPRNKNIHSNKVGKHLIFHVTDYLTKIHSRIGTNDATLALFKILFTMYDSGNWIEWKIFLSSQERGMSQLSASVYFVLSFFSNIVTSHTPTNPRMQIYFFFLYCWMAWPSNLLYLA
jgi:hypothetical protein